MWVAGRDLLLQVAAQVEVAGRTRHSQARVLNEEDGCGETVKRPQSDPPPCCAALVRRVVLSLSSLPLRPSFVLLPRHAQDAPGRSPRPGLAVAADDHVAGLRTAAPNVVVHGVAPSVEAGTPSGTRPILHAAAAIHHCICRLRAGRRAARSLPRRCGHAAAHFAASCQGAWSCFRCWEGCRGWSCRRSSNATSAFSSCAAATTSTNSSEGRQTLTAASSAKRAILSIDRTASDATCRTAIGPAIGSSSSSSSTSEGRAVRDQFGVLWGAGVIFRGWWRARARCDKET